MMGKVRQGTQIKILIVCASFMCGLFYTWSACLASLALLYFLFENRKTGFFKNDVFCVCCLIAASYLISTFWAVDKGMAPIGFAKFLALPLFAAVFLQTPIEERKAVLTVVAYIGAVMTVLSTLLGKIAVWESFFYVNPLEVLPEACHKDERKFHVKPVRQKWFGCACCPPNLARLISSIGSYAFTENEDTLFVHLYMGSNVEKTVNGKTVNVQMESDMPWEGNIKIRVQAENAKMTLALRIPGWCKNYKISGIEDGAQEEKDGYLYLKKVWNREENFCIDFPMEVQMFAASERVREDIGKAAIMRGPVVYCLEEKDNGKNLHELLVDTDIHASVSEGKICDTVVKMVETDGWRLTESGDAEETLYHMYQKPQKQKVRLHYIPYYTWANRGENEMQVWTRVQNP